MLSDHWKNFWKSWGFVCKWQTDMAKCKKNAGFLTHQCECRNALWLVKLTLNWLGMRAQQPFWPLTLSWKSARGVISSQKTNNQPDTWCLVWCRFFPFTSIDFPLLCQITGVYSCVPGFSRFWVWGLCFGAVVDGDEKSPFLRFDGDHPNTTNCKPMKIIANIWQVTSLIQPSTGIFCVQPADGYRHQFNRQSLWFSWLWWGPFFQLQHVSTLSIMLVNFNHLQYWQNKKRLWNHLGERGYGQPMSIHHFWRDFALYWHWRRFLSVKIPNFRNNKTFSMATSLPHKKMGELPSSKLTWQ